MIRRVRRGHVIVLLVLFGLSLTPLTCVEPVHAGGGSPPPPSNTPFPVLYVHSDHLGSTTLLTCYKQGTSCADGNPLQYFRYDGYGMPKLLFPRPFHIVHTGDAKTDRLYTSQRWDALTGVYDYGARHYDPRIARFLTHDPVREYMNPYAYVRWNPVMYVDPTGMIGELWGTPVGFSSLGYDGTNEGSRRFTGFAAAFAANGEAGVRGAFYGGSAGASAANVGPGAGLTGAQPGPVSGLTSFGGGSVLTTVLDSVGVAAAAAVGLIGTVLGIGLVAGGLAFQVPGALVGGVIGAVFGAAGAAISGQSILQGIGIGFVAGAALGSITTSPFSVLGVGFLYGGIAMLSSATTQYAATGSINWDSAWGAFGIGLAAGNVGARVALLAGETAGAIAGGAAEALLTALGRAAAGNGAASLEAAATITSPAPAPAIQGGPDGPRVVVPLN